MPVRLLCPNLCKLTGRDTPGDIRLAREEPSRFFFVSRRGKVLDFCELNAVMVPVIRMPVQHDARAGSPFLQCECSASNKSTGFAEIFSLLLVYCRPSALISQLCAAPPAIFPSGAIHSLKRVFSSASGVVFLVSLDDFDSLVI
jgi:hypothetical protein